MTESTMHDLLVRLATDPEFAGSIGDDPAALAARHGLTAGEAATVLAAKVDSSTARPGRLEERLSRSGLVVGAGDLMPVVDPHALDVAAEPEPQPEAAAPPEPAPPAPEEPPADSAEPAPVVSPRFAPDFHTPEPEPPPAAAAEPEAGTETGPDLASPGDDGYSEQAPSSAVVSTETHQTENGSETRVTYRDGSEDVTVVHPDGTESTTHTVPTPNGSLAVVTGSDGSASYTVSEDNDFTEMFGEFGMHTYSADDPNVHTVTNSDGSTVTTINTLDRDRHTITVDADGVTTYEHMIRNEDGTYAKVTNLPDGPAESSVVVPPKPQVVATESATYSDKTSYADGSTDETYRSADESGDTTTFHKVPGPDGNQLTVAFISDDRGPRTVYAIDSVTYFALGDPNLRVTINDNGTENVYITMPGDGSHHYIQVDDNGASTYVRAEPNGDGTYTQTTRFPDGHTETEILVPEG